MIGYLRGRIIDGATDAGEGTLTMDVGGVGYELTCSSNTLGDVQQLLAHADVQLWVQTQLREDSLTLFGFSSVLEKRMFNSLLKVNGVGPKMAIKILSAASIKQLTEMIEAGDVKALSNLPKVGKKTAEQLILALKGKLVLVGADEDRSGKAKKSKDASKDPALQRFEGTRALVLSALVNLGFRMQEVEVVVEQLPADIEVEQGVRQGLQALAGSF